MSRPSRIVVVAILVGSAVAIDVGCNPQPVGPAASADASASTDASVLADASVATIDAATDASAPSIGPGGGVVEAAGGKLTIPAGAFRHDHVITMTAVTGDALKDWPRGTHVGFVFEPVDKTFRVPATIELPHAEGDGEVVCWSRPGERLVFAFESAPAAKPFPIIVSSLPGRCAVYTAEHVKALSAVRKHEASQVEGTNKRFRWEIKGKVCDPHELVRPNAGKDLREPPGVGGCPSGMAPVHGKKGVCIDRWEAHVVVLLDDGTEHTWTPYFNPGALKTRAKSAPGAVPQAYISQVQATDACKGAGKRLCKDDEWVAACKSSKQTRYPYGNDEKRGTCNDHRDKHPAMQYLEAYDLSVFTKLEHPCINQVETSLLPTGAKKECVTPDGVYDIVGNLHEWTAAPEGTFRGGYYVDTWLNGKGCDYATTAHEARYWDYSTGFRCCADASK